jgi:formate dehydrogenase subunit delta
MQSSDKLVMMANQIVRNLAVQGDDKAVLLAADHMRKFWEPRMRANMRAHYEAGAAGLTPLAKLAVAELLKMEASEAAA